MKTYAEARGQILQSLRATSPCGEGPNGELIGAITVPFEPLSDQDIDRMVEDAAKDDIAAAREDWLNHGDAFTNITFVRMEDRATLDPARR